MIATQGGSFAMSNSEYIAKNNVKKEGETI